MKKLIINEKINDKNHFCPRGFTLDTSPIPSTQFSAFFAFSAVNFQNSAMRASIPSSGMPVAPNCTKLHLNIFVPNSLSLPHTRTTEKTLSYEPKY